MNQTVSVTVRIMGTGSYLPERVVTNDEIAPGMGSTDEWIVSHTGIKSRHFASNDESSSSLGVKAGERALAAADALEAFFASLGLPTRLAEAGVPEETDARIVERLRARGWKLGEDRDSYPDDVAQILAAARPAKA